MLERVLVCLLAGGHLLIEGVPGLAKTLTIKTTAQVLGGSFQRIQFTPDLVPSDLVGTRIFRPGSGDVRHRARAGLLQLPARGRDQPRAGEGAVGAARGDAGAPGDDRRRRRTPSRAVPRHGDAEPDRVRGHVPAARGAGRPLHAQDPRRLPRARRGADRRPALARSPPPELRRVLELERLRDAAGRRPRRSTSTRASSATPSQLATATREPASARARPSWRRTSPTAPARAARSASSSRRARSRSSAAATTSSSQDVEALAKDALRHRLVLSYQALAEEVDADHDPRRRARARWRAPELDLEQAGGRRLTIVARGATRSTRTPGPPGPRAAARDAAARARPDDRAPGRGDARRRPPLVAARRRQRARAGAARTCPATTCAGSSGT